MLLPESIEELHEGNSFPKDSPVSGEVDTVTLIKDVADLFRLSDGRLEDWEHCSLRKTGNVQFWIW